MTKKTTAAKTINNSVNHLLKENAKLAKELEAALTQVKGQEDANATLLKRNKTIEDENESLRADCASLQDKGKELALRLSNEQVSHLRTRDDLTSRLIGANREATHYRKRMEMAESELFMAKSKLFEKIHEHEAITPADHSALTAVLPALCFDRNGNVM